MMSKYATRCNRAAARVIYFICRDNACVIPPLPLICNEGYVVNRFVNDRERTLLKTTNH